MTRRCAPLAEVGDAAWRIDGVRISREIDGPQSPFTRGLATSINGVPLSALELDQAKGRVRDSLDKFGPVALEWSDTSLYDLTALYQGANNLAWPKDEEVALAAARIVPCYAGQPCDQDSLPVLGVCVGTSGRDCQENLIQSALALLPNAAKRDEAQAFAQKLLRAIQSKDWQALGLAP